jgi:PadR family transcriptional regulator, regulatory protein PadR
MKKTDLMLQGTLDMLVLKALAKGPMHGYDVVRWLHEITEDELRVEEGSLYPALHRLERRGWIEAEWGFSNNNRKAKYYEITKAGRKQLTVETSTWRRMTEAIAKVLLTS